MSAKTSSGGKSRMQQGRPAAKTAAQAPKTQAKQGSEPSRPETKQAAKPPRDAAQQIADTAKVEPKQDAEAAKGRMEQGTEAAKADTAAIETAVKTNSEVLDKAHATGKEGLGKAIEAGNQAFSQGFEQVMKVTKEQVGRYYPDAVQSFDELAAVQKSNVDAFFAAHAAVTKGAETIGEEIYAFNRKTVDAGIATMKAMLGVKSAHEAFELQSVFARERIEDFMAEGTKLSELTIKLSRETAEPISSRLSHTVDKAFKTTAA